MCATATKSPRPCDRCACGIATGTDWTKDACGQTEWICAECAKRLSQPEYKEDSTDTDFVPYEDEYSVTA